MHVTFWLHIAMCCALVGGSAGIACSLSLQPCTVPSFVNWSVGMQEAMPMCIYVAASSSHCYLLVGSSASNSAPALFPTHPLLEDLTGCLLSCAACMCQHVGCTLPTDRQWIRWQVFICRYNIGQYWDNNLEWNAINCVLGDFSNNCDILIPQTVPALRGSNGVDFLNLRGGYEVSADPSLPAASIFIL